jgi:hypothetical protein
MHHTCGSADQPLYFNPAHAGQSLRFHWVGVEVPKVDGLGSASTIDAQMGTRERSAISRPPKPARTVNASMAQDLPSGTRINATSL